MKGGWELNIFQGLKLLHLWNKLQEQIKEVKMPTWLQGYRTYIAMALAVICEGIKDVVPEWSGIAQTIQNIAVLLGIGFARAAITSVEKKEDK